MRDTYNNVSWGRVLFTMVSATILARVQGTAIHHRALQDVTLMEPPGLGGEEDGCAFPFRLSSGNESVHDVGTPASPASPGGEHRESIHMLTLAVSIWGACIAIVGGYAYRSARFMRHHPSDLGEDDALYRYRHWDDSL